MSILKRISAEKEKKENEERELIKMGAKLWPEVSRLLDGLYVFSKTNTLSKNDLFAVLQERLAAESYFAGKKVTLKKRSGLKEFLRGYGENRSYHIGPVETFNGVRVEFYHKGESEVLIVVCHFSGPYDFDD